jgi:hypothetical protein
MLVQFNPDPLENFAYALGMEAVTVPWDALTGALHEEVGGRLDDV